MTPPSRTEINQIASQLEEYNRAYRAGHPFVDDDTYDRLVEQLRGLDPQHPFLQAVESENFEGRREIRHPIPMLSTEKAYTTEQLERFLQRVYKEAQQLQMKSVEFKVTPKLDGLAGRDDGEVLVSRGNGLVGYDITSAFAKGIIPIGGRGQGLGEIVVVKSYFDQNLSDKFEHPRNMVVGIVSSEVLNQNAVDAINEGMVHFVPYSQLPRWIGDGQILLEGISGISDQLLAETDYPNDGLVIEAVGDELKERMGMTSHHFRWQIAVKQKGETGKTTVIGIQWQIGRTGTVTPVLEVDPIVLSGATIRRVTAHHAGMLKKLSIGVGARIEVIRSGEVIPKLEQVIEPVQQVDFPELCPSCGKTLDWEGDFLKCLNPLCISQTERRISHWFFTLDNADWFGRKTVQKLVDAGYDNLEKIYAMQLEDFLSLGFGPVQSRNLYQALITSRTKPVEDWRFLAAFGIPHLGLGDSRKLLEQIDLDELFSIGPNEIRAVKGFAEEKSKGIIRGLSVVKGTFEHLKAMDFNLIKTEKMVVGHAGDHPIFGKHIVFTGKMQRGGRHELQDAARRFGAIVQTGVSGSTDYLICGEKVGQSKLEKAKRNKVTILTEQEYYQLFNGEEDK